MKNVLEFLEHSADKFPEKTAFADEKNSLTYKEFVDKSKKIGSFISDRSGKTNNPIAVLLEKSPDCAAAFFGVVYSGNFYVIIDTLMPNDRISSIFETLDPVFVLTDEAHAEKAAQVIDEPKILLLSQCEEYEIDENALISVRKKMIDTDPLYALFTSGSTGKPKGAVVSHKSVIAYAEWVTNCFGLDENTIMGNQTPFYFSMSVTDIYSTIKIGGTLNIIPKSYFSFPMKLIQFLNEKNVNTIYWVPSALCIAANYNLFKYAKPEHLTKIMFAGEVMPTKQLNYWRKHIPDAMYANLFGPTETTDICTYYIVDREFSDDESLPIGYPCDNCGILILKEDNTEAEYGEEGELCVRGSFLASGYYGDDKKTAVSFTLNPLNKNYPEIIYRTGDIVKYNEHGELIFMSRKDFQIKHMGYRIELGEIETAVNSCPEVETCVCVYDEKTDEIVCIFTGRNADENKIIGTVKNKLPDYMMPNKYVKTSAMPFNRNGKIDRKYLKNNYNNI